MMATKNIWRVSGHWFTWLRHSCLQRLQRKRCKDAIIGWSSSFFNTLCPGEMKSPLSKGGADVFEQWGASETAGSHTKQWLLPHHSNKIGECYSVMYWWPFFFFKKRVQLAFQPKLAAGTCHPQDQPWVKRYHQLADAQCLQPALWRYFLSQCGPCSGNLQARPLSCGGCGGCPCRLIETSGGNSSADSDQQVPVLYTFHDSWTGSQFLSTPNSRYWCHYL